MELIASNPPSWVIAGGCMLATISTPGPAVITPSIAPWLRALRTSMVSVLKYTTLALPPSFSVMYFAAARPWVLPTLYWSAMAWLVLGGVTSESTAAPWSMASFISGAWALASSGWMAQGADAALQEGVDLLDVLGRVVVGDGGDEFQPAFLCRLLDGIGDRHEELGI